MSSWADKNLSSSAQDKINSITNAAQSGSLSWAEANQQANAVRQGEGGDYTVSSGGHTSWDDGSSLSSYADGSHYTPGQTEPPTFQHQQNNNAGSDYLKELYAANMAAQLAALKESYGKNAADLEANAAKIPKLYEGAKNESAAKNALEQQRFNEYAAANGLNSGTSGQAALASSSVLQGNLAGLNGQQADALSENALEQQKLSIAYKSAIDQANASGNGQLASALYQEYVRQNEAAERAKQQAQEQSNWETQFNYGTQSDSKSYAHSMAMTMLQNGVMPDAGTLQAAGISAAEAAALKRVETKPKAGSSGKQTKKDEGNAGSVPTSVSNRVDSAHGGTDWIQVVGFGRLTWPELLNMVNRGAVIETFDKTTGKYSYKKNPNSKT